MRATATATWTFEVPGWREDARGLEQYVVEEASGKRVGRVISIVRSGDDVYVVLERSRPPRSRDLRAVAWEDVETVDHTAHVVRLRLSKKEVERALQLDPDKRVTGDEADARRITELPRELTPARPVREAAAPIRPAAKVILLLLALGAFSLFALVILGGADEPRWFFFLLAIPFFFLAFAGVLAYRVYHDPYVRDGPRQPIRVAGLARPGDV